MEKKNTKKIFWIANQSDLCHYLIHALAHSDNNLQGIAGNN